MQSHSPSSRKISHLKDKKPMNWSTLFTIAIAIILLRIFWLHVKANNANTKAFKNLQPKDQMAVLKECLLNNPTEGNLQNLKRFCTDHNISFDEAAYRPFLQKQLELAYQRANYIKCDELYVEECIFIDNLTPMEFTDSEEVKKTGNTEKALVLYLEGITRLYSDKAIESALEKMAPEYPKAARLLEEYKALADACNKSEADEKSLEKLRQQKEAWLNNLLTLEK